jgi:hypothetical protein
MGNHGRPGCLVDGLLVEPLTWISCRMACSISLALASSDFSACTFASNSFERQREHRIQSANELLERLEALHASIISSRRLRSD